ncbi:VOC family protein [Evansella clarkii]|uniref:VOC family protein n=1 Tax=Evansella clarkii TaxID=79879 RepID=UPI001430182E|nr:VOC family protein [Evansella clarkii]
MNFILDHIVHSVNRSPDECVTTLREAGLHAVNGGEHIKWGTHNSLFYLQSSYVEFLAVKDRQTAEKAENPLIHQLLYDLTEGEGISQICLRCDDIKAVERKLQERWKTKVFDGERKTSSGEWIRWKMLFAEEQPGRQLPVPFFIQWEEEDNIRFSKLKEQGILSEKHDSTTINRIFINVHAAEAAAEKWSWLIGNPVNKYEEMSLWESSGTAYSVNGGESQFIFMEPGSNGELQELLEKRGERPLAVQFHPSEFAAPAEYWGGKYY